jgi:integrase
MPRPRPPHLHRQRTRHGAIVWYVRFGLGKRIRIRGEYGTPEFDAQVRAALLGEDAPKKSASGPVFGTLEWLVKRYRESSHWADLAPATRKQREHILRAAVAAHGTADYRKVTTKSIKLSMERRKATPEQANVLLKALRGLFKWAVYAELVDIDPTEKVLKLEHQSEGFPAWSETDLEKYEERWPLGTRERVAYSVLLYTGLRRGDAVQLGRQHVKDGVFRIRTEKSQGRVEIVAPVLPELAKALAAGPTGDLAFIAGVRGAPRTKESFGTWFRQACNEAGVKASAHGLRKAGAIRVATRGGTHAQLKALFGWSSDSMASHYIKNAEGERLASSASHLLGNEKRKPISPPKSKVRK